MVGLKAIVGVGIVAASVSLGAAMVPQASSQTTAERIITDTPEFCAHLIRMMRESLRTRPPPQEVVAMSGEGERMCDRGEVRRGVLRLRQAMRLLMSTEGEPAAPPPRQ